MSLLDSDYDDPFTLRQPTMTLLSKPLCIFSHCCRIVLLEKDIERSIEYVSGNEHPSKLGEVNPYGETPTLLDRDIILYGASVIIEYLDERFPHPPLMPVDPVIRAKTRLIILRLTRDWLLPISHLEEKNSFDLPKDLTQSILDGLLTLSPLFAQQPFLIGDEYSMADAYLLPLLWRLPALNITLPKQATALVKYSDRMFKRAAFVESLSPQEMELR